MNSLANTSTAKSGQRFPSSAAVLTVVAITASPISVFAPMGLAPLALMAAVAIVAGNWHAGLWNNVSSKWAIGMATFLLFGAASAFWAIDPMAALYKAGQLLFIFSAGVVLCAGARTVDGTQHRNIGLALLVGTGIAAILLTIERYLDMPISAGIKPWELPGAVPFFRLNRASVVLAVLTFPAMWAAHRHFGTLAAVLVTIASLFVVFSLKSSAASLGLLLGLVIAGAALRLPQAIPRFLTVVLIAISVGAPFVTPALLRNEAIGAAVERVQASAYHRLIIWNFASERIAERPFLGWGLDSSRSIPEGHDKARQPGDNRDQGEILPLHPHNAALQIWLELGLIGLMLFLPLAALPLWGCHERFPRKTALAAVLGSTVVMLVVAFASFGLWQSWWLCALWISISLCFAIMGGEDRADTTIERSYVRRCTSFS